MSIIESIKSAGIIGLGGAGFPTDIKLNCQPKYLIVNGAECEPLLKNDRCVMLNYADRLVYAIDSLNNHFGGIKCVFALKESYKEEIIALESAIEKASSTAEIYKLESYYPAGDEQLIVYEVTGTPVPPQGLPIDAGAVVVNVNTLYSISLAIEGFPLTKKFITITGEVVNGGVYRVPIGISFDDCLALAGGATVDDYIVVAGGPMMGKYIKKEDCSAEYVKKTSSGYIVLPVGSRIDNINKTSIAHIASRAKSCCIQCRQCTDMCPRHLVGNPIEPHKIMRHLAYASEISSLLDDEISRTALLCSECGVCEIFACPMGLQPRKINSIIKNELIKQGIKYPKGLG